MKPRDYIPHAANWLKNKYRDATNPPYEVRPLVADFYLSIGGNCRTATQLNRNGLRICSSPLDWMMAYGIECTAQLFESKFESFFRDIKEHDYAESENRMVEDCATGMLSIHHFPKALSLEEGRKRFYDVTRRRFAFVDNCLSNSEHVVFVTNRTEPVSDLCLFLEEVRRIYSAKMTLVNIRQAKEFTAREEAIANDVRLIDYSFDDKSLNERRGVRGGWHQGNNYEWRRILRQCRRTNKFSPPECLERKSYN